MGLVPRGGGGGKGSAVSDRLRVCWLKTDFHEGPHTRGTSGRGTTRAEGAQGTPTQSHISPSILVFEDEKSLAGRVREEGLEIRGWG